MITGNEPAFATPDNGTEHAITWQGQKGLTIRQHFAAMAMQGICSKPDDTIYHVNGGWLHPETVAQNALVIADALIKELNKPNP